MLGRRALEGPSVAVAILVACVPFLARAQPVQQAPPPPVVDDAPPPPVVQNVAPAPPPPVVLNVPPPPPVVEPVPAGPMTQPESPGGSGKLFLSGLGTFVLSYGLTVLAGVIATATDDPAGGTLYVPVFGPLLFWDGTNSEVDAEGGGYLILSTVLQTVGIVGMFAGLVEIAGGAEPASYPSD